MSTLPGSSESARHRLGRALTGATRRVVAGSLVAGVAFAGVTGIAAASSSSSSSGPAASKGTVTPPAGAPAPPPGPGRGPGGPPGPGGPGDVGTVTAMSGSRLTLRTIDGTQTVVEGSSTTYYELLEKVSSSDVSVGDVVAVTGSPVSSSSKPASPGTGALDAKTVTVVEPRFTGRVLSHSDGTLTLVGPDGQLLSVSVTSSTRYVAKGEKASSSAVSDGSQVTAEGTRTGITRLRAALVVVGPAPGAGAPLPPPASSSSTGS